MTDSPENPGAGARNEPETRGVCADARPAGRPAVTRLWAGAILLACLSLLGTAAYLKPNPRGFGTHQQLWGQGPCGMLILTGLPCPTCGMTTAFAYTVRGQWLRAFWAQPAGFIFALGTAALAVICVRTLVHGRWPRWNFARLNPHYLFLAILVLLLGAWAFKIAVGLADHTLPYR